MRTRELTSSKRRRPAAPRRAAKEDATPPPLLPDFALYMSDLCAIGGSCAKPPKNITPSPPKAGTMPSHCRILSETGGSFWSPTMLISPMPRIRHSSSSLLSSRSSSPFNSSTVSPVGRNRPPSVRPPHPTFGASTPVCDAATTDRRMPNISRRRWAVADITRVFPAPSAPRSSNLSGAGHSPWLLSTTPYFSPRCGEIVG